jgi:hypothetical protein
MDKEQFKDIKGYEGSYQVSNYGRVKSLDREVVTSKGVTRKIKEKILTLKVNRYGYLEAYLCESGKLRTFLVHRLVASAFIDKIEGKHEVNHIDGNKANNRADNLEWCTPKENIKHAYDNNVSGFKDRVRENLERINKEKSYSKIILKKNNEILVFKSLSEASKEIGTHRGNISRCIRKGWKCAGWEVFGVKYANEEIPDEGLVDNLVGKITEG